MVSYNSNALIDMVEVLFSPEKVPQNVSKKKLVRKKRRDIGPVWDFLAPCPGFVWMRIKKSFCCGVGIVHCLCNHLYYLIWWLHPSLPISLTIFFYLWSQATATPTAVCGQSRYWFSSQHSFMVFSVWSHDTKAEEITLDIWRNERTKSKDKFRQKNLLSSIGKYPGCHRLSMPGVCFRSSLDSDARGYRDYPGNQGFFSRGFAFRGFGCGLKICRRVVSNETSRRPREKQKLNPVLNTYNIAMHWNTLTFLGKAVLGQRFNLGFSAGLR